jgi:formylglycine-generating enzyme required for sulfatase activity
VVPAGTFRMGSAAGEKGRPADGREGPQHEVTLGRLFAVGRFHVTVDQFAAFVSATGYEAGLECFVREGRGEIKRDRSWRNPGFLQASHPAVCFNLMDARAYVDWLVGKTGKAYRLLTELDFAHFWVVGQGPTAKIGSASMMRRASLSGTTVLPKGPVGRQRSLHSDQ